ERHQLRSERRHAAPELSRRRAGFPGRVARFAPHLRVLLPLPNLVPEVRETNLTPISAAGSDPFRRSDAAASRDAPAHHTGGPARVAARNGAGPARSP